MTRRASLELPDRGPTMLCGRCTPKNRFASCTVVCYEDHSDVAVEESNNRFCKISGHTKFSEKNTEPSDSINQFKINKII